MCSGGRGGGKIFLKSALCPAHNSEYPAPLRFAQIGSRWSPTSGTRRTLDAMPLKKDFKIC